MNRRHKLFALAAMLLLPALIVTVMAQGGPPVGGTPPCWPPPCIPIDGGIGILAAAGAMLGYRKLRASKR